MNELTLEVAKKMLELIANQHKYKNPCAYCYIINCSIDGKGCSEEFLNYWQKQAEISIKEKENE